MTRLIWLNVAMIGVLALALIVRYFGWAGVLGLALLVAYIVIDAASTAEGTRNDTSH